MIKYKIIIELLEWTISAWFTCKTVKYSIRWIERKGRKICISMYQNGIFPMFTEISFIYLFSFDYQ